MKRKIKKSNNVATKNDIQGLRSDFKSSKKSLFGQMLKLEEKIENVEDRLGEKIEKAEVKLETKIDKLLTEVSNFAGRVETLEKENELGADQIHRVREDIKDHKKRITRLESPTAT